MIDGPEGVLNCNEENKPKITDNSPPHIEKITIFLGVSDMLRAIAVGIITVSYTHLTLPTNREV